MPEEESPGSAGAELRSMLEPRTPVVVLACPVMQDLIEPHLESGAATVVYMDYGLHVRPQGMAARLQQELEALPRPSLVLLGYGLCGNGLAGLHAGRHTLVIPRADDCIAVLLGSREAYLAAHRERPGTYYLTRGWLEAGSHPLGEYRSYVERFGQESADHLVDALYASYTHLRFVAATPSDLENCGPLAREVADFCASRWGMSYEEQLGSDALIGRLLDAPRRPEALGDDFIVVPPGGCVEAGMFLPG